MLYTIGHVNAIATMRFPLQYSDARLAIATLTKGRELAQT